MGYLKYVSFLYIVMAGFFVYSGIMSIIEKENSTAIISFAFAAAAVFMFFFRRHFQKKFQDRTPKN